LTRRNTFDSVDKWISEVAAVNDSGSLEKILIGNKKDLKKDRVVDFDEALQLAKKHDMNYIETSAKSGNGCDKAISTILDSIYKGTRKSKNTMTDSKNKVAIPVSKVITIEQPTAIPTTTSDNRPYDMNHPDRRKGAGGDDCQNC